MTRFLVEGLLFFTLGIPTVHSQSTNLPDVPPGIFNASTRVEIRTTITAAWDALTDFPSYAKWNPFVRSAIVVSPLNITLPEQYPAENKRLSLRTQIPPLPLPVDGSTPDNPLHTNFAYENITHVQPDLNRLAWEYLGDVGTGALNAERWQALSDLGNGLVLYESREVFSGPLAETLKALMGESLQKSFDAQGEGLKLLLEGVGGS